MTYNLRLPAGALISGVVRIPCCGHHNQCSEIVEIKIDDIDKEGFGGDLDTIQEQCDETSLRCPECRDEYIRSMERDEREVAEYYYKS